MSVQRRQVFSLPHNIPYSLPHIEKTGGGPPPPPNLTDGLLHWWYFEEANGLSKVDLVSGNNLTLHGFGGAGSENQVTGLVNEATELAFQSTLQGSAPVDLHSGDFTIVGVFNVPQANSGIFSQSLPKETQSQWWINTFGQQLILGWSTDGTRGAGAHFLAHPTSIPLNTFHTYMAWRDTANNQFILALDSDGGSNTVVATFSGATALFSPVTGACVFSGVGNDLFISGGIFDETGVWNRVLTQEERTFIYNSGAWRTYSEL